jgi:pyruvate/2-oxoglutarate dehydrogenase complex dihydrolipoamide acyltransferase (E2) component
MRREIIVPEVGFPAPVLSLWYARPGEQVFAGDRLVELLLGSATFDVAAPCDGRLVERTAWPDDILVTGQVIGTVEEDAEL